MSHDVKGMSHETIAGGFDCCFLGRGNFTGSRFDFDYRGKGDGGYLEELWLT
jgi:hypothetical protein